MKARKYLLLLTISISSVFSYAQNGKIRGTVIDEVGEPLFSANAVVKGTTTGATTDFDGNYELSVAPGTYDVVLSFIGYKEVTVTGIVVKTGDVTVMSTISLKPSSSELEGVTITASQMRNTEAAVLITKKNSVNVLDGISSQSFRKIGDATAAAAVTRVPGVSVQGGKYVYVRGLGDRYTKTQLNGLDIPGLDPDRNSLQMDIFPTNIIDNIIVLKSFTAELPADFVGGLVNIETKEFPEKPVLNVSVGLGYTPEMHFNSNYRTQTRSSTDFIGFDSGNNGRKEPMSMSASNPSPIIQPASSQSNATESTKLFNSELASQDGTSFMNYSLGVSGGNQYKKEKGTYGFNAAFSYKNNTDFYDDRTQNYWLKNRNDRSQYELQADRLITGDLGVNNVFLSGLLGGAYKTKKSKYSINLMHLQNGETRSGYFFDEQIINNSATIYRDNLEYSERSITNMLIGGEHNRDEGKWNIAWKVSPTLSRIADKDVRITPYLFDDADGSFAIDASEAAVPQRIWRNLNEYNVAAKLGATREHKLFTKDAKLKFGTAYTFKYRDYEILNYNLESLQSGTLPFTGDADELLTDPFIWTRATGAGMYLLGNYQASNTFSGSQSNIALYASEEFSFANRFKSVVGIRMEKYDQFYTGVNQAGDRVFDNDKVLEMFDLFPSASLIFLANEKTNIRVSYFKTVARPSFKEKSTAEIADVLSGSTFIGNIDLVETDIQNFDLRYEIFFEKAQTISVSAFYKSFTNPIEMVSFAADPGSIQPRNVGDARVLGIELEARVNLGSMVSSLERFSFNTNVSVIDSRVEYDKSAGGEFEGKQNGIRDGEVLGDYRDMQGQAPYIVNAGISYAGKKNGLDAGIFYNVQGRKLAIVGINFNPNVYTVPFHNLNFNLNKKFGEDNKYQFGFGIDNILGDLREAVTESYSAEEQIYFAYNPGRTFSLSFRYAFR